MFHQIELFRFIFKPLFTAQIRPPAWLTDVHTFIFYCLHWWVCSNNNGQVHDVHVVFKCQFWINNLYPGYYCACSEINFSDKQQCSMVFSIISDCWWHLKTVAPNAIKAGLLYKSRTFCSTGPYVGRLAPQFWSRLDMPEWHKSQPGMDGNAWTLAWVDLTRRIMNWYLLKAFIQSDQWLDQQLPEPLELMITTYLAWGESA